MDRDQVIRILRENADGLHALEIGHDPDFSRLTPPGAMPRIGELHGPAFWTVPTNSLGAPRIVCRQPLDRLDG